MNKWDRELLHRALDLQLDAMEKGKKISFNFPCIAEGVLDMVTRWDFARKIGTMGKDMFSNGELQEELDRLEEELHK